MRKQFVYRRWRGRYREKRAATILEVHFEIESGPEGLTRSQFTKMAADDYCHLLAQKPISKGLIMRTGGKREPRKQAKS